MGGKFPQLLFSVFLLCACQPSTVKTSRIMTEMPAQAEVSNTLQTPDSSQISQPTQAPGVTPQSTQASLPTSPPLLPGFKPPDNWYVSNLSLDSLQATLFSKLDPALMQEQDEPDFPQGFAAGALVVSPLPANSDPQSLRAGLHANLEKYGAQDLEGMLFVADEIGLIDMASIQEAQFTGAQVNTLAGQDALVLDGVINFGGEPNDLLQVRIWFTWSDKNFIVFYELAENENWQLNAASFEEARNSIRLDSIN